MEPPTTAIPAASKLTRKTSSLEREGWWRMALTSLELSPGQYELLPAPVPKYASRSFVFRSSVQRFPTGCFTPSTSILARLFKNPGPRSVHSFSTIPQAARDHSQNGPRT
ncbi:protein STPG4 isoform X2 [Equus przewalskii]|uniref:Protein STPG4 isoform X2 n=1 Tax=Equus przewalskii TaxID=9798 RepID=A0ABM4KKW5_EQUPR